jgi:hypothetical protein
VGQSQISSISTRMMASISAAVLVGFFIRRGPASASKTLAIPVW